MKKIILSICFLFVSGLLLQAQNTNWTTTQAQVGLGTTVPNAKMEIKLDTNYPYNNKSGLRITYPIPQLIIGLPQINENIFEIRRKTIGNNFSTNMVVKGNGNTGFGLQSNDPLLKYNRVTIADNNVKKIDLNVRGFALLDGPGASLLLGDDNSSTHGQYGIEYNAGGAQPGLNFWKPFNSTQNDGVSQGFKNYIMFMSNNGDVGIDTDDPQARLHVKTGNVFIGDVNFQSSCGDCSSYRLFVRDGIRTEEVKVDIATGLWADYVFEDSYELKPLEQLEAFVLKNHHLPKMPSAETVEKEGINLGEMDAKLLEKIEELTLYVISLKKELDALKSIQR